MRVTPGPRAHGTDTYRVEIDGTEHRVAVTYLYGQRIVCCATCGAVTTCLACDAVATALDALTPPP